MALLGNTFTKKSKKNKGKGKNHKKKPDTKKKDLNNHVHTNKFRVTTEIALTGTKKNPLKSKMSGFFIKFSFKNDEPLKKTKLENVKNKSKE